MQYFKGYAFIKRTCLLLSPLFLVTLASKELAFYSPAATLSPIFGGLSEDINLIRKLESELGINTPIDGIESYGDLMIQKTSYGEETWIEQENPLGGLKYGQEFKYEKLDENPSEGKKIKITKLIEDKPVYRIDKASFDASDLKDKGGLSLLTVFDLNLKSSGQTVPITHVASLSDLINAPEKKYSVVKVEEKESLFGPLKDEYSITLRKKDDQNSFSISLEKNPEFGLSSASLQGDLSTLTIKFFYVLYNEEPPLNPERFFSTGDADATIIGDVSSNPRAKKVFLSRWSNENSKNSWESKYNFQTKEDFWKSTCEDPYKVGGFIDEALKDKPTQAEKKDVIKNKKTSGEALSKQKESFVEFRPDVKEKPTHEKQYYWEQFDQKEQWVPSDDNIGTDANHPCENLDKETEAKLKKYSKESRALDREPLNNREIKNSIIPEALKLKLQELEKPQKPEYPKHKIIQSSFRAWGNTYNTEKVKGRQVKEEGIHSSTFERAVKTNHTFEINIGKEIWKKELIDNDKLKDKKDKPDISSIIEVNYPISFEFYDPISNYLTKNKVLLKTELDLKHLYLQSHYSKEVFRFDIGRENKKIGEDYQGFDPIRRSDKKKEYGLDGIFSFVAGLELDKDKNLKISLTAQTSGFVNTKNPSCDLRHRLYKIKKSGWEEDSPKTLDTNWKCSPEEGWKYRDYIHIPSFLVVSLTGEPEVSSFYVDNNSEIVSATLTKEQQEQKKPKTIGEFEKALDTKKITKVINTDDSNNGEIYFQNIAAYNDTSHDVEESTLTQGSWIWKTEHQKIHYYTPLKQENSFDLEDLQNLKSLKFYASGSKYTHSSFFHSGHFSTIKTLCISKKYISSASAENNDCADGFSYETRAEDKKFSELSEYDGIQTIEIDASHLKNQGSKKITVNFRTVLNMPEGKKEEYKFKTTKTKLEELFKNDDKKPDSKIAADFSLLAVWYSLDLEWKEKKFYYTTKLRPISMVSEAIGNSTTHKTSGAAGSAGFEITKIELNYS